MSTERHGRAAAALLALTMMGSILAACQGPAGQQGPPGTGAPSISAVTPWQVFPARSLEVVVSGNGTQFDASASIDLGAGVTVSSVRLVSPTQLVASAAVAADAAMGLRDVKVTGSGYSLVATGGFEVVPSLAVDMPGGPLLQGDIAQVRLASLDDQLLSPDPSQPNPQPAGMYLWNQGTQDGVQYLLALVDALATPGPRPLSWSNPMFGGRTFVADPAALSVGARSPVALAAPSTTPVVFDTRSKLFSVSTSQLGILSVRASAVGSGLAPEGLLLPESGEVALVKDMQDMSQRPLAGITDGAATTSYVVVGGNVNTGTGAAFTLTLDVSHTAVASVTAESAVAHDGTAPQAVTPPAIVSGALATGSEVDAYSMSVPSGSTLEVTIASLTQYVTVTLQPPVGAPLTASSYFGVPSTAVKNTGATGTYTFAIVGEGNPTAYQVGFRVY